MQTDSNMDPAETSLVLRGGTVVTMDAARRILNPGAVVIARDRIAWVGAEGELPLAYAGAPRFGCAGQVLYPGFINLHTHAALSILRGPGDDSGVAPAYSPNVPQGVFLSPQDIYVFTLLGGLEALRFGTTCIVDNYIHAGEAARALAELGLRAVVSERIHDANLFRIPDGVYEFTAAQGDETMGRGIEVVERWHGAAEGRLTARLGPHAPDTCSSAFLERIRQEAEKRGLGLVTHLAQSRREVAEIQHRAGVSPVRYLAGLGLLGPQMIAGHCILVSDDDLDLLAQTRTCVSHQSVSNAKGGYMAPVREMLQRGTIVGLGTDNMAGDMLEVMRLAVLTARMRTGDAVALRAQDALEMATVRGAEALGLENEIGSIEPGKKADLVLVDYRQPHLTPNVDPVANLVHNGLGSDVSHVWVDGRLVVAQGQAQTVDTPQVLKEAQARATARYAEMARRRS